MFCPHCGSEIPDGSEFCDICGESTDEAPKKRDAMLNAAPKKSKQPAEDDIAKDTPYSIAVEKQSKKRGGGHRIAVGVIAVALVAACAISFVSFGGVEGLQRLFGNGASASSAAASASAEPSADSSDASASSAAEEPDEAASSNASEQQSSVPSDPTQKISFDGVTIKEDSLGRYFVTGKITNSNDQEYTAKFQIKANEHSIDAYKEDSVKEVTLGRLASATPLCSCDGRDAFAMHLQPGQTREFKLYPGDLTKAEISYTDAHAELLEATMPGSVQQRIGYCSDNGDLFEIKDLTYTSDGKVTGKLVNKSKKYFKVAYPIFMMQDASGDYSVKDAGGTRPAGIVTMSTKVENMAPGNEKPFEVNAGKEYATAVLREVHYEVDTSKGA